MTKENDQNYAKDGDKLPIFGRCVLGTEYNVANLSCQIFLYKYDLFTNFVPSV
jgi:hypothetical protein